MNCDDCQPLLLDLVSGELDADQAAAVRGHAQGCDRCAADLRVLEEGLLASQALPRLRAPAGVREFVLSEAKRQSDAAAIATKPPPAQARAGRGGLRWLSRFAELAMSPQVAMVAVLLLMISVGLYYLPPPEPQHAAVSPLEAAEEVPSPDPAGSATAVPVQAEPEADDEAPPATVEEDRAEAKQKRRSRARREASPRGEGRTLRRGRFPRKSAAPQREQAKPRAAPQDEDTRRAFGGSVDSAPRNAPAAPSGNAAAQGAGSLRSRKGSRSGAGPAGAGARTESAEESAASGGERTLALALEALRAGRHAEAARLAEAALERGADARRAHAVAAEAHRRAGSCGRAAPHYQDWRRLLGSLPPRWADAVRCFDRIGNQSAVESWLSAAEGAYPAEAARVRDSLGGAKKAKPPASSADSEAFEAQ